jgi:hypothetical protein
MWRTLRASLADDPALRGFGLERLIDRATAQRRRLDRLRERAAGEALAG